MIYGRRVTAPGRGMDAAALRGIAFVCFAAFAVTVAVMPLIERGYDPARQTISEAVLLRHGEVQTAGLYFLGFGSFALAGALFRTWRDRCGYAIAGLVAVSAVCVVVLTIFPADYGNHARSIGGWMHNLGAGAAFLAIFAGMCQACWPPAMLRGRRGMALVAFPLAMIVFGTLLLLDLGPRGLVQRVSVGWDLLWLTLIALGALRAH